MNLKKGFRRLTLFLSIVLPIGVVIFVVCEDSWTSSNWYDDYYIDILLCIIPFLYLCLIYYRISWLIEGFRDNPQAETQKEKNSH